MQEGSQRRRDLSCKEKEELDRKERQSIERSRQWKPGRAHRAEGKAAWLEQKGHTQADEK